MIRHRTLYLATTYLVTAAALTVWLAAPAGAEDKLARKLVRAAEVSEELIDMDDPEIPARLLDDAECVAIVPSVIKGALVWGGRHGRGVISCRNDRGKWSPPAFVTLSGGSFGLQIGGASTDLMFFFMNRRSIESLLKSKFVLGADASLAAGPVGRSAEASTDGRLSAEIFAYAKSRGLFAGVSLEGARLAVHHKANERYYGRRIWPEDILFEHRIPRLSAEGRAFVRALP